MRKTEMRFIAAALAGLVCTAAVAQGQRGGPPANAPAALALQIADFAAAPITGSPDGTSNNAGALARINFLREEPGPKRRFFVNDLTGPLYILERTTKQATTYLDFNGRTRSGLFHKLGAGSGL